jgi:surface antigen
MKRNAGERALLRIAAGIVLALGVATALAGPPAHAPAHGWRAKNDPYYQGYSGKRWVSDYGVVGGHCDAGAIGAVLGGVAGAAIGKEVADETGAVIGAIAGVLIGREIDRSLDGSDRGCVSHALDLGHDGQPVRWSNAATGRSYSLTPHAPRTIDGRTCRDFVWDNGVRQTACLRSDGTWAVY